LSLFWANLIQSPSSYPTSSWSILILFSYLWLVLPSDIFPEGFRTKILW
jgi:hypothetical protein